LRNKILTDKAQNNLKIQMPIAEWKIICEWESKCSKFRDNLLVKKIQPFRQSDASDATRSSYSFVLNQNHINERLFISKYRYGSGILFFRRSQ
jgi:hypothetical protein